tara:strand:- start:493 stop:1350 length:858 start_codon:yes stop_codon:yes gene_type:complete
MTNQKRYIELQFPLVFDAGEIVGFIDVPGFVGAWNDNGQTKLYWDATKWSDNVIEHIQYALRHIGVDDASTKMLVREVPDKDWNEIWNASVVPIWIGHRIVIRPSWHPVTMPQKGIELILDPKQAFGTGHHATTQLLVEWLDELIKGGEEILDIGTGSGILAMVALRCGAHSALGIDPDQTALECATGYAKENGFSTELVLKRSSLAELCTTRVFDVILANLDKDTILSSYRAFTKFMIPSRSVLLLSGILSADRLEIQSALVAEGWSPTTEREKDGWIAMAFSS